MSATPLGDSMSVIRMAEHALREILGRMQGPMARMSERCKLDLCRDHEAVRSYRATMELLGALQADLAQAARAEASPDAQPRPRCACTYEAGDSPCPMHGMEEPEPVRPTPAPPAPKIHNLSRSPDAQGAPPRGEEAWGLDAPGVVGRDALPYWAIRPAPDSSASAVLVERAAPPPPREAPGPGVACVKCLAEHADDCPDRMVAVQGNWERAAPPREGEDTCECGHGLDEHDGGGPDDPHHPTCEHPRCKCRWWRPASRSPHAERDAEGRPASRGEE